jgi:ferredoxin/flavodoxin---NADP+ reductase
MSTRIAIVGAGPAGFYAAGHLLSADEQIEVDMIERLPTPWGLVRSGVAPDHPKIKSVTRVYEKTAADPRFRFFGNVELGRDVSRDDLLAHYHAVVYATGSPTDRTLDIPGEQLPGSCSATDFVGWYNGHPDFREHEFDLSCSRAVVIGNGNVAIDVARMLTLSHEELVRTDIADHALDALDESTIEEIVLVGRRGPAQAAFTNPELRELGELRDADVVLDADELERALSVPDPNMDPTAERNVKVLREYAGRAHSGSDGGDGDGSSRSNDNDNDRGRAKRARRLIVLRFLLSPIELRGDETHGVQEVVLARNELVEDTDGRLRARDTGERETIAAGLVMRAIGYQGVPLPGVPFDERLATIANDSGRVTGPHGPLPGEYTVGWIKRGPSGVIGTNKKDAQQTVDALLEDMRSGALHTPAHPDARAAEDLLRERVPELVTYEGWSEIDRHEQQRGRPQERPRVKLTRIDELLRAAAGEAPTEEPLDTLGLR